MGLTGFPKLETDLAQTVREAALDYESFQTPLRACDLSRCKGMCCHDGVFVGREEREVIEGVFEGDYFEKRGTRLKTKTSPAEDQLLGEGYATHFPKTRCVFLDEHHHCRLQSLAMREERHPWFWKPFPCWLHPLGFRRQKDSGRPLLSLPSLAAERERGEAGPSFAPCTTCGKRDEGGRPAWQVLQGELSFLSEISGRNLLKELSPTAPRTRFD